MTVNVVVLAGTVAADPVQRRMPSGDEVTELRLSVPEAGRRLLPLPVAAWHATVGANTVDGIAKGDAVLVHGQLVRRFYDPGRVVVPPQCWAPCWLNGGSARRDWPRSWSGRLRLAGNLLPPASRPKRA